MPGRFSPSSRKSCRSISTRACAATPPPMSPSSPGMSQFPSPPIRCRNGLSWAISTHRGKVVMTAQTATRSGDAGAMVDGVRAKILVVTGIFPPDAGGPASYVPTMAASLCQRGHTVEVVTLSAHGAHDDTDWPFRVHRIRRRLFWPWRLLLTVFTIWRLSRGKDLVYVNGLGSEAALGAWLARRPTVHKIVGDYAWERARARGWFRGTIDAYQHAAKSCRLRLLDYIRTRPLRGARRVIVPSDYMRQIVAG